MTGASWIEAEHLQSLLSVRPAFDGTGQRDVGGTLRVARRDAHQRI